MPFVPIGSRKRIEVILDDDKERIINQQRSKDTATLNAHRQVAPGTSGYRFANHPSTLVPDGRTRGPDVPFTGATSTWRPPSADPDGPARQKDLQHAEVGARWEASHSLRTMRSSPSLSSSAANIVDPGQAGAMAGHPLAVESRRWQKLAHFTEKVEMKDLEIPEPAPKSPSPQAPEAQGPRDLVNFPKYMLYHNCHLKHTDLQRFQQNQLAKERAIAEGVDPMTLTVGSIPSAQDLGESAVKWQEASWGAPVFKNAQGHHWAGSALPAGRGQRSSNPFRMG